MEKLLNFGRYLQELRRNAGFSSLDMVMKRIQADFTDHEGAMSRSMLNLYERGQVSSVKPETLRFLSELYQCSYEELSRRWFQERFQVAGSQSQIQGPVESIEESAVQLQGSLDTDSPHIRIINLDELRRSQECLPAKSQVGVVALDFLDDNVFFELVTENLRKGISYYYFMSEDEHLRYKALLTRIGNKRPSLRGKLDGKLTHFIPRPKLDFPVNYVVYVLPNGQLKAYVGILAETQPIYFQEAGLYLTLRLYESFRWALAAARDPQIRKANSNLALRFENLAFSHQKKNLAPIAMEAKRS